MSTATSPEVAVSSEQVTSQQDGRFIVVRDGGDNNGSWPAFHDRDEAAGMVKSLNSFHGDGFAFVVDRLGSPAAVAELHERATALEHRMDAAERIASIGGNGSDGHPADATEPATDVVVPGARFGTVTIPVEAKSWRPFWLRDVPQQIGKKLRYEHARILASLGNRDSLDWQRSQWHFVVPTRDKSYCVVRVQVSADMLPSDPHSYQFKGELLYVPIGTDKRAAKDVTESRNDKILLTAHWPREWNIAVRDMRTNPKPTAMLTD
jgi:hypothetical protein